MSFSLPGKIVEEYTVRRNRLGLVQFAGTCRPVFLDLVPDAHIGDYVRVQVGFATERVSEADAIEAYQQLAETGQSGEAELATEEAGPAAALRVKPR